MKKSSPFQIALLCTFGGIAVAAVLIFSIFLSDGEGTAIGPVTLWGTFDEPTMQQLLSDASAAHKDLVNVTYVQKNATTYEQELLNSFASGNAPDLFFLTDDQAYQQQDRVVLIPSEDLARSLYESTFIDGALPFVAPEGTIALPVVADPIVMYWNKDILAAAGFSRPPETWDEMLEFTQRITKKNDSGTIERSAIAFGSYTNVDHAKDLITTLIIQAGGSITGRDSSGRLLSALLAQNGSATAVAAAPSAIRFYTDFADPSKQYYTWSRSFPESRRAFTGGTLALYFGRASEEAVIMAANPNLNLGVAPIPQIKEKGLASTGGVVYGVAIPKGAQNPRGARLIQWLLASKEVSPIISTAFTLPSARRDVLDQQRKVAATNMMATQAILIRSWTDPDPARTEEIFRAMIDDMTSGTILLSEAITRVDQQMNALIGL